MNFYKRRRISGCLFSHFSPGLQGDCTLWSSFCILPLVCIVPLVCSLKSAVRSLRFMFLHWQVSTALKSTLSSRQINSAFSNTELETLVGLLNWTTHYLIPSSLRFSIQSNYFLQYFPISIWRRTSFTFSFPDSLRFVLERETWPSIELNGA